MEDAGGEPSGRPFRSKPLTTRLDRRGIKKPRANRPDYWARVRTDDKDVSSKKNVIAFASEYYSIP